MRSMIIMIISNWIIIFLITFLLGFTLKENNDLTKALELTELAYDKRSQDLISQMDIINQKWRACERKKFECEPPLFNPPPRKGE